MPELDITTKQVFAQSIARQVASYTDLNIEIDGEYYLGYDVLKIGLPGYIWPVGSLYVEIDNWLVEVLHDMYGKVRLVDGLDMPYFSSVEVLDSTDLTEGFSLSSLPQGEQGIDILGVQTINDAKEYKAYPGDPYKIHNYNDADSIYKALNSSPVYLVNQGNLYIFPVDATTTYNVEYMSAPNMGITVSVDGDDDAPIDPLGDYGQDDITRTIEKRPSAICQLFATSFKDDDALVSGSQYMPDAYLQGLVYGVSSKLLSKRMLDMQKKLPTLDDYSGDIADEEVDMEGWQKVRYYVESEEDAELTQIKIAELGGQQQQWVLKYQWYGQQKQLVDSLYMGIFNAQQRNE